MKTWRSHIVLAGLLALAPAAASQTPRPIVVELFTSQGCSACPKANDFVARLASQPGVIALSYSVGHWDYLGWRDTFAKPEFAKRQKDYAKSLARGRVYTPQIVIDGVEEGSGARTEQISATIAERRAMPGRGVPGRGVEVAAIGSGREPDMRISGASPDGAPADIWLVAFIPGERMVPVKAGENAGRTVRHANVVLRATRVGTWEGGSMSVPTRGCTPACAVLIQAPGQGQILGAGVTMGARPGLDRTVAAPSMRSALAGP